MSGHPRRRALRKQLDALVADAGASDALDFVCDHLAAGGLMLDLQTKIERATQLDYNEHSIRRALEEQYGRDEVAKRIAQARGEGASAQVEQAMDIADNVQEDRNAIAKASERIRMRQWMASKHDRATYGDTKTDVNVNVSFAALHLDALRARKVTAQVVAPVAEEAQLLTDGSDA